MWAVEPTGMQTEQSAPQPGRWTRGVDFLLTSQYDTGNGVEESVRFLLLSLYDLEFGVEESTGPGLLHVQYGWIDGVEESRTQQHYITLLHFDTVLLGL